VKLALSYSVPDPIKAHNYRFGSTLFDGGVCNAHGGVVVHLDGSGRLGAPHFL
jgi:hypothetical protein